jgi:hypothetical protein
MHHRCADRLGVIESLDDARAELLPPVGKMPSPFSPFDASPELRPSCT